MFICQKSDKKNEIIWINFMRIFKINQKIEVVIQEYKQFRYYIRSQNLFGLRQQMLGFQGIFSIFKWCFNYLKYIFFMGFMERENFILIQFEIN